MTLPKPNRSGNLRGQNPASHGNRKKTKEKRSVSLTPQTWEQAIKLAESSSEGIDKLFAMLPVFQRAKVAIMMLIEQHPNAKEYAEAVLIDLEDLEIETLYKECETEGLIEKEGGAWIV